jgi:hypothetical protein
MSFDKVANTAGEDNALSYGYILSCVRTRGMELESAFPHVEGKLPVCYFTGSWRNIKYIFVPGSVGLTITETQMNAL